MPNPLFNELEKTGSWDSLMLEIIQHWINQSTPFMIRHELLIGKRTPQNLLAGKHAPDKTGWEKERIRLAFEAKGLLSRELTYPLPAGTFESMTFLFP